MNLNLLYWKEWREQRSIVAAAPVLTFALLTVYGVLVRSHAFGAGIAVVSGGVAGGLLGLAWLLSAALCGTSIMAPEINAGTLRFLSMLPLSRARIWRDKIAISAAATVLCIAAATLAYLLFCAVAGVGNAFGAPMAEMIEKYSLFFICALVFAVGCYVTMLLENSIAALLATIVVSLAATILTSLIADEVSRFVPALDTDADYGQSLFIGLTALLFFWLSYRTFQLGETLKTSARFRLLIAWPRWVRITLVNGGIIAAALIGAYFWIVG